MHTHPIPTLSESSFLNRSANSAYQAGIIIPCYNEERRFSSDAFRQFAEQHRDVCLVFVNDGSTDRTLNALKSIEQECVNVEVLSLSENQGKAEAVRFGMNHGITKGLPYLGFWDADLSTPLNEVQHFLHKLKRNPNLQAILGSQVRMLGTNIQRRALRHFVGRFYATLISIVLQLPIYDSQCGAKLFKSQFGLQKNNGQEVQESLVV